MGVPLHEAQRIAAELDARLNGYASHALVTAQALTFARCGGCVPRDPNRRHLPGCPESSVPG